MKKRNGFTLIELLAVIIILAIIALIATPIIINVVEDMKTQGFKQTALGYYKAAEYVYDEMFMDGKTENIQFTFQNGKQTSSNSNYKLEVKGETPQGGLVYLTKEGHIVVSINNNKYCAYVDGNKEVTINEDINHCGYTPVPEECYDLTNRNINAIYEYTNFGEYQTSLFDKTYNMLTYHYEKEACPNEFNMWMIPSEINGQKVEGIASIDSSGIDVSAKHVIIPSGVKIIEDMAFTQNVSEEKTIQNVIIPDGVLYIGLGAFSSVHLKEVIIPDSVEIIGQSAFGWHGVNNVKLGSGVKIIEVGAFSDNEITSITIPNGILYIENSAFENNKLNTVTIPASVIRIGSNAFANNSFPNADAITIEGDATRFDDNWTEIGFPAK